MVRYCLLVLLLGAWLAAVAGNPTQPFVSPVSVTITADDRPALIPEVEALLATDAADRLNTTRPAGMSEAELLGILLTGDFAKLDGFWPTVPLTGDPAKFTKNDYLASLNTLTDYLPYLERRYGTGEVKPDDNAAELIPLYAALWKLKKDPRAVEMITRGVKAIALAADAEREKFPTKPGNYNQYWKGNYALVYMALVEIKDCPEFNNWMRTLGESIGNLANAWPVAEFKGSFNMAFMTAFFYDFGIKYHPTPLARATELKAYSDAIWNEWYTMYDCNEEDPHYTAHDLLLLHAWSQLRGVVWWDTPEHGRLWRQYMEQVANDGTWPTYGDGGAPGDYPQAIWLGELLATKYRDGRYKWLAHRAFWNARPRLWKLCVGSGYLAAEFVAFGVLYADDAIKETPPTAGVTLTQRHWMDLTPGETRLAGGPWFNVDPKKLSPRTLMFRSGGKETDHSLLLMAGQLGGHGHMNAGNVLYYGGDLGGFLDYPTLRLDLNMEACNGFTLRDPKLPGCWPGRYGGMYTTEDCTVPVVGSAAQASYARVHIQEYPGTTTTAESWQTVQTWKKNWTLEKAIGYRNWPLRLDRSLLFVNNKFTVVRDVAHPLIPITAQMGQNWTFGELGAVGTNWVNVWMPKALYAYGIYLRPIELEPRDLLIWFAPQPEAAMEIEKAISPRKDYRFIYVPANSYINLPLRAWYTRTGDWTPGAPQAFTTVLVPHAPGQDAAALAATISVLRDTPACTLLQIKDGDTTYLALLNTAGNPVTVAKVATDAESALLTFSKGKLTRLAAWHATSIQYGAQKLLKTKTAQDLDVALK